MSEADFDHCEGVRRDGQPCSARPVRGERLCAGHLGLGVAADPVGSQARSATARRAQANARKRRPQDVYADALTENAETFAARLVEIAKGADNVTALRAIEALNARVLGRPKETVEQITPEVPEAIKAIREMNEQELADLYRRLEEPDGAGSTPRPRAGRRHTAGRTNAGSSG